MTGVNMERKKFRNLVHESKGEKVDDKDFPESG